MSIESRTKNNPGRKRSKQATIDDVAEYAGVSIKTVSRVVNREPNVRIETRERVLKSIKALNYRPNLSARSLAGDRSYLIGLLYDNPSANYVSDLQVGALKQCHQEGYYLLVEHCDYDHPKAEKKLEQLLDQSNLDSLILTPPLCDQVALLELLQKRNTPFVRIAPNTKLDASPRVYIDDYQAAFDMTKHLISLGHRDIGFIKGHPDHGASYQRYNGFIDAMNSQQLSINDQFIEQGYFSYRSGMDCAEKILSAEHKPSAIFAADDDMAAGVASTAHKFGISIPNQLSLAGFDDSPISRVVWPQLTTVHQPLSEMAAAAVQLLIQNGPASGNDESRDIMLDFKIIIRESTAAP